MAHPYFSRPPPKSTGRELFGATFLEPIWGHCARAEDMVATHVQVSAIAVSRTLTVARAIRFSEATGLTRR